MKPSTILRALFAASASYASSAVSVGDTIPTSVELHYEFPPEKINVSERLASKNAIIVGLPGAFTPTWSTRQVPGYLAQEDELKKLGVDEVLIYCVNDAAVMSAWSDDQGVMDDSIVKLMGDPYGDLTSALDMIMTHPGPTSVGLVNRSKRFALYVEDNEVKIVRVAEAEDDPAGDDNPDVTLAEAMVDAISALKESAKEDEL